MKLITENGELSLPADFSFTIERNNPFFSDDGDASIPASIPATKENLSIIRNIHRIDRSNRFISKIPAILQSDTYINRGQLIIDSLNVRDGINVSFAIENSDVYSQFKEKTLKEILVNRVRTFGSVQACITQMQAIYEGATDDYTIFPVAIAAYESENDGGKVVVYQFNNEVNDMEQLIWRSRTQIEDDYLMAVPDGYGISPFLYLHSLIDILFDEMGYVVVENCFDVADLRAIIVVNNCSDTIVKGKIKYSDLVPSCTLSEFIDFLLNKFCVQISVNSSSKKVKIQMLQNIIASQQFDLDLSNKIIDDYDINISQPSRIVLNSSTNIEGAEPAATTFDELMNKYKFYNVVNEQEFAEYQSGRPPYYDCLIFRKATGTFYELRRNIRDGSLLIVRIGSNYFKYDRKNTDEAKEYNSIDEIPPMIIVEGKAMPYIGYRLHFSTTFNMNEMEGEQRIILCWREARTDGIWGGCSYNYGTTQKYGESGLTSIRPFSFNYYDMYDYFWKKYNELFLNNLVTIKSKLDLTPAQIQNYNITSMKLLNGQLLLPKNLTFNISTKTICESAEFLLIKNFVDKIKDVQIINNSISRIQWILDNHYVTDAVINAMDFYPIVMMNGENITPAGWDGESFPNTAVYSSDVPHRFTCEGYTIQYLDLQNIYLGPPNQVGEISYKYDINFNIILNLDEDYVNYLWDDWEWKHLRDTTVTVQRTCKIWFVAIPY